MDKKDVDNSKEITYAPSLTSLLKPTTEYLGEELKSFVKEKIEAAKEAKKSKNIQEHVKKVQEKIDNKASVNEPSLQQLDLFNEWVENVAEIDPANSELSEMWQNLLISMAGSGSSAKILMPKLKKLDPEDAIVLLKIGNKLKSPLTLEDRYRLKKT